MAQRVNSIGVFLKSLRDIEKQESRQNPVTPEEILTMLHNGPLGISDLMLRTGAPFERLIESLRALSDAGLVSQNEIKEYFLTEQGQQLVGEKDK